MTDDTDQQKPPESEEPAGQAPPEEKGAPPKKSARPPKKKASPPENATPAENPALAEKGVPENGTPPEEGPATKRPQESPPAGPPVPAGARPVQPSETEVAAGVVAAEQAAQGGGPGEGPGRYVCVHGHFYQPPRENPWLEAIEIQDSARPYHDWNERISAECYGPNGASRLLDGDGRIRAIINNYAHMSFNFGPTLLSWMKEQAPEAYQKVLHADAESRALFDGHGSALAQAYNHLILPLANSRDKRTQVVWGLRDFESRFQRPAEGMWLPETAVDLESLAIMAEHGVRFTVLSPHQARQVRDLATPEASWQDVDGARIDPTRAYLCRLPGGGEINLFFYDGPISQAIAFERLLTDGQNFAGRLLGAFSDARDWPQLVHIATDGETYGHHFRHGDMALAYALETIPGQGQAALVNYAAYLEKHPPAMEVEIIENSSWSCIHGVERWRSDCGCNTGGHPGWNQAWRAPLRQSLDWLRDALVPVYERVGAEFFKDVWAARDAYIEVILDRSPEVIDGFIAAHVGRELSDTDRRRLLDLLELQRHALLMFTSCGWFFDELSGIETVQVLQYAARALQLARDVFGEDLEEEFLKRLQPAQSNLPENGDGRRVWEKFVRPAAIDLVDVGAHFALSSLYEDFGETSTVYTFDVDRSEEETMELGAVRLKLGRAVVTSRVTQDVADLSYAVLNLSDQNLDCRVKPYDEAEHRETIERIKGPFAAADFTETQRILEERFDAKTYTLRSAFRDQQRKVLASITSAAMEEIKGYYHAVYERYAPLMFFLSSLGAPRPRAFDYASELVLNDDLREAFQEENIDAERIRWLLQIVAQNHVPLDEAGLALAVERHLEKLAAALADGTADKENIGRLATAAALARELPFEVDLWTVQNRYYQMLQRDLPDMKAKAEQGDTEAQEWVAEFLCVGESLWVKTG